MLALEDKEYLKEVVDNNYKVKKWFEDELNKDGYKMWIFRRKFFFYSNI